MADPRFKGLSIRPFNDIELDAAGNLVFVTEGEAISQHVRQRVSFYRGEWFLDPMVGVDWIGRVLGRSPTEAAIMEAMVKATILKTPGVTGLREFDISYDRANRGARVTRCEVETEFDT